VNTAQNATTFDDYADKVLLPYIRHQLETSSRLDLVWDTYTDSNLKHAARETAGKGQRTKVLGNTRLPDKWNEFLHEKENKQELFKFLTQKVMETTFPDKLVLSTYAEEVVITGSEYVSLNSTKETVVDTKEQTSNLSPCDHVEADTRIVHHLQEAVAVYAILDTGNNTSFVLRSVTEKLELERREAVLILSTLRRQQNKWFNVRPSQM
jgi:hypothetical protein